MQGNRESTAKIFPTFRFKAKCKEIGKAKRRLSLRSGPPLNVGNRESNANILPTLRVSNKCREIGKAR